MELWNSTGRKYQLMEGMKIFVEMSIVRSKYGIRRDGSNRD